MADGFDIIDCHGHVSAPDALWVYKSLLLSHRGEHGKGFPEPSDEEVLIAANKKEMAPCGHLDMLDKAGTRMQLLSPRPFQQMHSEKPGKLVHWFCEQTNNIIARQVKLMPERFLGVAGIPQVAGEPIEGVFPELERAINTLGFKGCLLNPDPYENGGTEAPPMGDRYWYPLYEKLCALDVPAHIHSASSRSARAPYTLNFLLDETTAVYGLLHSPEYRERYADNLSKELPRIPRVETAAGFWGFSKAGRELAALHLNYETVEPYPLIIEAKGPLSDSDYLVEKMKFAKKGDKTSVIYNGKITLRGIPEAAWDYVVNGKAALDWVMERQGVKTDKASGIVNDANDWAIETMGDPKYPLELFQRVVTVSLETQKIVAELPELHILEAKVLPADLLSPELAVSG